MMALRLVQVWVGLVVLLALSEAVEYFVSVDGDDNNIGTPDKPWRHVQKAATTMIPGDVCTIRGGVYDEEVTISGLQGTKENPITFRSYPGEIVTFDGTVPITSSWEKYKDNIYVTTLEEDIWQLFVDGEMQINARWPNAFWYDYSVFDYTKWGFADAKSTFDPVTGKGVIVDNGTQDLAKSGLNATGAIAILNIGSWMTWAGLVKKHDPGEDNFAFDLQQQLTGYVKFHGENSRYFLEDKLEFLDAPSEWFYDKNTKKLYLWTRDSDHPGNRDIRGKVLTYAFEVTNKSTWLILSNLNFFATTIFISGDDDSSDVSNIRLDSLHFSYPSYSKRMIGSLAVPNMTTIYYNGLLTQYAGNYSTFNCTWEYADGQTMSYRGADGVFENNLWHHNDFSCVGNGNLFQSEGVRDQFIRNTVHSNGPSVGFAPGSGSQKDRNLGVPIGSNICLNHFHNLKYLQDDGAHVQTHINAQNGTVLEYNWSHDTLKYGLRFDGSYPGGYNGTVRCNILWKTRSLMIKGDDHHIENNLSFDNNLPYDLMLLSYPGDGTKGENAHTISTSNIFQHGACAGNMKGNCTNIPGNFTNNAIGSVQRLLRDPDNLDFRPKQGSDLVAKDIGPYGQESMEHGGYYWIPGRQQMVASMPIPPDGTDTAKCDADLMWLAGYGSESHDVYFGIDKESVASANSTSHDTVKYFGQLKAPSNVVEVGVSKMDAETTYYWRVDARGATNDNVKVGPVWQFKCKD